MFLAIIRNFLHTVHFVVRTYALSLSLMIASLNKMISGLESTCNSNYCYLESYMLANEAVQSHVNISKFSY